MPDNRPTIDFHPAHSRGAADHGWLKAKHSFSFGQWYNPDRSNFGALRVLNDDWVAPGAGFGKHPHKNMEIITIPLTGALKHQDSTGGEGVIRPGEVQVMSAGTGVFHSEVNASSTEPVTLFQTWIVPKRTSVDPRYDQRAFAEADRYGLWQMLVSPIDRPEDDGLKIHQDAWISRAAVEAGTTLEYVLHAPLNGAYVLLVEGAATVEGQALGKRDAAGISGVEKFLVEAREASDVLVIEVPM